MHRSIRKLSIFNREEIRTRQNYGFFVLVTKWSLQSAIFNDRCPGTMTRVPKWLLRVAHPRPFFCGHCSRISLLWILFFQAKSRRAEATPSSLFVRPWNAGWFLWMLFLNSVERGSLVPYVILNCQVVMGSVMAWGFLHCPWFGWDISLFLADLLRHCVSKQLEAHD